MKGYLEAIRGSPFAPNDVSKLEPSAAGLVIGLFLLTALAPARSAAQEQPLLTGIVIDEERWVQVASARVTLVGTGLETTSLENGTFSFPDAPLGTVSVRVEARGYASMVQEVTIRPDAVVYVQFILPSLSAFLDELFVVGRREPRASALSELSTAADLLIGQVPGRTGSSGIVGAERSQIQLRGVRSLDLVGEPVVYLDGIRLAGGFGGALSALRRIPASDVREIEILRGPAAAFLEGSADGAIHVRTRSGANE